MHMVVEGELAVKLYANDVEFGTTVNGNRRQDKVIMGRGFTVLNLLKTKALVLWDSVSCTSYCTTSES